MVNSKPLPNVSYRRPFYAKTQFFFIALLVIAVYSYGWRVTEIDLGALVQDAYLVKPLVRDLLRPDILTFETRTESADAIFILSDQQFPLSELKKSVSEPALFRGSLSLFHED